MENDAILALIGVLSGGALWGAVTAIVKSINDHKLGVRTTESSLKIRELDADERLIEKLMDRVDKQDQRADRLGAEISALRRELDAERSYSNRMAATMAANGIIPPERDGD